MQTGPHPTHKSPFPRVGRGSLRLLASLLTALWVGRSGHAQESTSVTIGPNPIGAGTSLDAPRTEPLNLGYKNDNDYGPASDGGDPDYYVRRRFFLPIHPPALADAAPMETLGEHYPVGLLDHLGEPYYTAYGSLLAQRLVSAKRAQRLVFYQGEKQQLLNELRAQLDGLVDAPAGLRADALAELSARQTPRLRELEHEAEAIREELTTPRIFKIIEDGTGLDVPQVKFADSKDALLDSYLQIVSVGQLQNGLSFEQRQLLAEISMQEWFEANEADADSSGDGQLFFLPATSRIRLPAGLPPGLLSEIQVFREEKDRLKAELRAAIVRGQGFLLGGQRTEAFAQLAAHQAPQFAALESLAEKIRVDLAPYPQPAEPARSDLPADLTRRVGAAIEQKAELQRKLSRRLRELRAELPWDRVEIIRQDDCLALTIIPGNDTPALQRKGRNQAMAALPAFNEEMRRDYTALAADMATVRRDIQRHTGPQPQSGTPGIEQLAREFSQAYAPLEIWNRYRDYYSAVLEPGLSPEQRRLLYQGALIDLRQSGPTSP
jgi:hypothetical protein